ncbi:MAG: hypothetical protein FJZ01_12575 [Candidatus Sericytochromatia bacterium]|nr:hypothetical protein [Candidatus Tanganyikabacteria bacterium]
MTDWDFIGRRQAGPVPRDVVAAIGAALQAYLAGDRAPKAASDVIPWGLAGRREAVGYPAIAALADLDRQK